MEVRDTKGRFAGCKRRKAAKSSDRTLQEHDYGVPSSLIDNQELSYYNDGWKHGRRIIELGVLLSELRSCQSCFLGPVALSERTLCGELQKGLGGYLYVRCENVECGFVNRVAYGKTHHLKNKGMPCFAVNTKLGTAMNDTLGGSVQVNNLLAALNLKPINSKNLKYMEERAGEETVLFSKDNSRQAAKDAFNMELNDIAEQESLNALEKMDGLVEDLGVCPLPGASPSVRLSVEGLDQKDDIASDIDEASESISDVTTMNEPSRILPQSKQLHSTHHAVRSRIKLASKFPCKTQTGMSCAVDTAWQKRGYDSLTSHTFFMSKSKYGKKVLKTVVSSRTCSVCNWWRRNRPNIPVRDHKCVKNHSGSARSMEGSSGVAGVKEMVEGGTPVEYLEGDGDNTLIAKLRSEMNIDMKKRFDKNHVIKNIGKTLYALRAEKGVKLSKSVIEHVEKCLKYAFAINQGHVDKMRSNLKAIIPHQFGDHSKCYAYFCNFKRNPTDKYVHRSLPYKAPLKDKILRERLERVFDVVASNAEHYVDLGSSQQCEHANKEVALKAPKSHHYGGTRSLVYKVHAAAASVNEGRLYIPQLYVLFFCLVGSHVSVWTFYQCLFEMRCTYLVYSRMDLSPGYHSEKYYQKCMKRRLERQQKSGKPAIKRRRLILKKERAINQGAQESLEGASYQSGIGHQADPDIDHLPDAVPQGDFKKHVSGDKPNIITFDLETTDLIRGGVLPHITQIAATNVLSGDNFNVYVTPRCSISIGAQQLTGITIQGDSMSVNGQSVDSINIKTALQDFSSWLERFSNVCLVAHNGRTFDYPVLFGALDANGLKDKFIEGVESLVDSKYVFKDLNPKGSHTQVNLVSSLLGITYDAHNALADVENLGKILVHSDVCNKKILKWSFKPVTIVNRIAHNSQKNLNIRSLDQLVSNGVCKRHTAENIAGSGLNLNHLKIIHNRGGEDGLRDVFLSTNSEGHARVTRDKKTLDEVLPKLAEFLDSLK